MSTKLSMTRDINGYNAFGVIPTQDVFAGSLVAGAAQTITVPSNNQYWLAIFNYTPGASVWVNFTTTATVPTSTVGAFTSVLNPAGRMVLKNTTISFITSDTNTPWVCVELQAINNYTSF